MKKLEKLSFEKEINGKCFEFEFNISGEININSASLGLFLKELKINGKEYIYGMYQVILLKGDGVVRFDLHKEKNTELFNELGTEDDRVFIAIPKQYVPKVLYTARKEILELEKEVNDSFSSLSILKLDELAEEFFRYEIHDKEISEKMAQDVIAIAKKEGIQIDNLGFDIKYTDFTLQKCSGKAALVAFDEGKKDTNDVRIYIEHGEGFTFKIDPFYRSEWFKNY